MKIKLDENLGRRGTAVFRAAGHDVDTVVDEGLASATDDAVRAAATHVDRVLVTLDLDFAHPRLRARGGPMTPLAGHLGKR